MKKILFLSLIVTLITVSSYNARASAYTADDNLIDQMLSNAPEAMSPVLANLTVAPFSGASIASSDKDAVVAIVLSFFLGWVGVHRFYLGTEVLTGIGYILTCGGLGIVNLVDFIVLIIDNKDISKYVNNPRFFMWAK
jgi:TM2 domain-containing membrane protein YozV